MIPITHTGGMISIGKFRKLTNDPGHGHGLQPEFWGRFKVYLTKGKSAYAALGINVVFSVGLANCFLCFLGVNALYSIVSVNALFSVLSLNSDFSVLSVNSAVAVGCSGQAFKVCLPPMVIR